MKVDDNPLQKNVHLHSLQQRPVFPPEHWTATFRPRPLISLDHGSISVRVQPIVAEAIVSPGGKATD